MEKGNGNRGNEKKKPISASVRLESPLIIISAPQREAALLLFAVISSQALHFLQIFLLSAASPASFVSLYYYYLLQRSVSFLSLLLAHHIRFPYLCLFSSLPTLFLSFHLQICFATYHLMFIYDLMKFHTLLQKLTSTGTLGNSKCFMSF